MIACAVNQGQEWIVLLALATALLLGCVLGFVISGSRR